MDSADFLKTTGGLPDAQSSVAVDPVPPQVYGGNADGAGRLKAPASARVWALAIAIGCLAVLITAASLRPSPRGYGSHTWLGLQSCQFLERTGIPCPACGMTTSFTWFVRGNLLASLYVQPMGMTLALLAACSVWVGFYVAATGRPVYRLLRLVPSRYYVGPLLAMAVIGWAWKVYIHLKGWDGWG